MIEISQRRFDDCLSEKETITTTKGDIREQSMNSIQALTIRIQRMVF